MSSAEAVIRQDGEGERFWFAGGGVFTMKATAVETAGAFTLIEDWVVRGKTTPLHLHPDFDEAIYVLAGELLVHVEGESHRVGKHGFFLAPRGVAHAFLVTSETAHLLALQTPGSGEAFYRTASEPLASGADEARAPDLAKLRSAAESSPSIELLGPPPFGSTGKEGAAAVS